MRIIIAAGPYIPVPPVKYGGTELVIHYLINGLQELGHEVTLLASGDSKVNCRLIPVVDEAIYFPRYKKDEQTHQKLVEQITKKTHGILRKIAPSNDIIHSHGFDLKGFSEYPNLTTLHGPILIQNLEYFWKRRKLNYVTVSANQQAAMPELNYVDAIYNGEDPDRFPFVSRPENYLSFIGRFDREKNPHLAIQLALALGIKIKLAGKIDLLGDGYFEEEIEKYLDHPLVEYIGEVGFDEKIDLISNALCNLHPTGFREPFGLTVLEAAYCGTPTLAINRGSMPELIEEGRTGYLVEDFVEGYKLIDKCFELDRRYISNRARLLFNYQNMSKHYVRAYEKVIQEHHSRLFGESSIRDRTLALPGKMQFSSS